MQRPKRTRSARRPAPRPRASPRRRLRVPVADCLDRWHAQIERDRNGGEGHDENDRPAQPMVQATDQARRQHERDADRQSRCAKSVVEVERRRPDERLVLREVDAGRRTNARNRAVVMLPIASRTSRLAPPYSSSTAVIRMCWPRRSAITEPSMASQRNVIVANSEPMK